MRRNTVFLTAALCTLGLSACSVMPKPAFPRERNVSLDRFMGPWYVIAHIPPSKTKNAYNEIERYSRGQSNEDNNKINVRFTYREGSFTGKQKTLTPTGYVVPDSGNAVWAMQFFWPIKLQYVISYVDSDYQTTIVAREKRDYVWIMARKPTVSDGTYAKLKQRVAKLGYNVSQLRKVPQQPLDQRNDLDAGPGS